MPRTIPAALEAKLNQKQGIEPVYLFEIQWTKNGQFYKYATKSDVEGVRGGVLDISNLESVVKLDQQGQTQAINLVLSDVKGELKTIIDVSNIHGRPVNIYIWESSLPESEKALLMQGEINGPITWSEGDRTLSFQVVTKLADAEVGFSPEQGIFPDVPNALSGKAWPFVFGSVQNVPAPRLQEIPRTSSVSVSGAVDPTLETRLLELGKIIKSLEELLIFYAIALGSVEFQIDFEGRDDLTGIRDQLQSAVNQIATNIANAKAERTQLQATLTQQEIDQRSSFNVNDSSSFPQGKTLRIVVQDIEYTGKFSGNTFNIQDRRAIKFTNDFTEPFGFTFVQSGQTVRIESDSLVRYVANMISSDLNSIIVRAFRGTGSARVLTVVPSTFYTKKLQALGPDFTVTLIEMTTPLSTQDSEFEDDIFVTQTSPVGPNTVDVIEYLIDTFTDLKKDSTSFADVRAKIDKYPSHFALTEQFNVLALLESILFQSRCAGFVSNNTVFLKYLSEEQTATSTFTDSDSDAGTIELSSTPFEDVATKIVATWTDDLALEEKNKIVLRHNVSLYGLREREIDFFIYNIPELVLKSATFWLIRFANIWKQARFKGFLDKLDVETFDTVNLSMTGNLFATGTVAGLITDLTIDTTNHKLDISCWLPVKFGTMETYVFSWPSDADIASLFPTIEEEEAGLGGSASPQADVKGDLDFNFGGQSISINVQGTNGTNDRVFRKDKGDSVPSDIDDVKPTPTFQLGSSFETGDEPTFTYTYGNYEFEPESLTESATTQPTVFHGVVVEKSGGSNYVMNVFVNGLGEEPIRQTVEQQQITDGTTIPTGTSAIVVREAVADAAGVVQESWWMQVPVWI